MVAHLLFQLGFDDLLLDQTVQVDVDQVEEYGPVLRLKLLLPVGDRGELLGYKRKLHLGTESGGVLSVRVPG